MTAASKYFWQDKFFWLAMLAGPVVWITLYGMGQSNGIALAPWLVFLKIALLYPILEEIVFRGGVQTLLMDRAPFKKSAYGISLANVVTSIVFAGAHLINQSPVWAALVFFPSIIFGIARERYDSLVPSIILHVFYNAGFVLLFFSV